MWEEVGETFDARLDSLCSRCATIGGLVGIAHLSHSQRAGHAACWPERIHILPSAHGCLSPTGAVACVATVSA